MAGRGRRSVSPESLLAQAERLSWAVGRLRFGAPVTHVYNPLRYAAKPHAAYLRRFGAAPKEVVLLGMNPGPFGMAQTGVPFGEVEMVRDWLGIEEPVTRPRRQHPKRPVEGFSCTRSEVSGRRLWGWARSRFKTPERFFRRFFVLNYCPLVFMEAGGRNRTPDKLAKDERAALYRVCDRALLEAVRTLEPRFVVGVGRFAETRATRALAALDLEIGAIPHPSPASPAANRGWEPLADAAFKTLGIAIPNLA